MKNVLRPLDKSYIYDFWLVINTFLHPLCDMITCIRKQLVYDFCCYIYLVIMYCTSFSRVNSLYSSYFVKYTVR